MADPGCVPVYLDVPQFDMDLAIPLLKASLSDHEYQLMTSVAADNFAGGRLAATLSPPLVLG
jgi:hypothetical protein